MRSIYFLTLILSSILAKSYAQISEISLDTTDIDLVDGAQSVPNELTVPEPKALLNSGDLATNPGDLAINPSGLAINPPSCDSQSSSDSSDELAMDHPLDMNVVEKRQDSLEAFKPSAKKLDICTPRSTSSDLDTAPLNSEEHEEWYRKCRNVKWEVVCCSGKPYRPRFPPDPDRNQNPNYVNVNECVPIRHLDDIDDPLCKDPSQRWCCLDMIYTGPQEHGRRSAEYCLQAGDPQIPLKPDP